MEEDQRPLSIYPDAKSGPLGEERASYAKPRKWATKGEGDSQQQIIIGGVVISVVLFVLAVALFATVGKGRLGL